MFGLQILKLVANLVLLLCTSEANVRDPENIVGMFAGSFLILCMKKASLNL